MSSTLLAVCLLIAAGLIAGVVVKLLWPLRPKGEPNTDSVVRPYTTTPYCSPVIGASASDGSSHAGVDGGSASP